MTDALALGEKLLALLEESARTSGVVDPLARYRNLSGRSWSTVA